jgi:hypothetical protein
MELEVQHDVQNPLSSPPPRPYTKLQKTEPYPQT